MKLSDMIDLLEKLKSQDGDIEITEISVELNESRTTTIPMKAYANALKSKKADTGDFCLYFHNAPISKALEEQKNELLRQISLHDNRGASSIEELSEKLVITDASNTEKCGRCNGYGSVVINENMLSRPRGKCPICGGTGRVKR